MTRPNHRAEVLRFLSESRGLDDDAGTTLRASYRATWQRGAAQLLLAESQLKEIGHELGRVGVTWLPIKGVDLATRGVFEHPEERPFSDVDIMVVSEDLDRARSALNESGWQSLYRGEHAESYLIDEGYAWPATRSGTLLEVHHRLWGLLPTATAPSLIEDSLPAPELGPTARRPSLAWAWVLAAVHGWLSPHRDLLLWRDLERVSAASSHDLGEEIETLCRRFGLALPLTAACAVTARIFDDAFHDRLVPILAADLRPIERLTRPSTARDRRSLGGMILARTLSARPARRGWRSIGRHFWPHPGVVEQRTPSSWTWPKRRLACLLGIR